LLSPETIQSILKSYEEKCITLREVVDRVFYDLQRLYVEAQNQSLQN